MIEQAFLNSFINQNSASTTFLHYNKAYLEKPQQEPSVEKDHQFVDDIRSITEILTINLDQKKTDITNQQLEFIQKKAIKHSQANILNENTSTKFEKISKLDQCKCGCNRGIGQPLSLMTDLQHLTFLGSSLILFFMFVKRLAYLLIIIILVYNIYALFTNIFGEKIPYLCADNILRFWCIAKMYTSTQMKDPKNFKVIIQLWLGFFLSVIWIIGIRLIRKLSRQKNTEIDVCLESSSDYSILIHQLPYGDITQSQIIEYLKFLWQQCKAKQVLKQKMSIKSVQIIYRTKEIRQIITSMKQNIIEIHSLLEDSQYKIQSSHEQQYYLLKQTICSQLQQLKSTKHQFLENQDYRKKMATSMCLVQFGSSHQQNYLLKHFGYTKKTLISNLKASIRNWYNGNQELPKFKGQSIRITRSPQPSDLNWLACEVQVSYLRISIVWMILLIIVFISFGCLLIIRQLRQIFPILKSFALLISISLQLFNRIIWNTLLKIVNIQENNTKTDSIISVVNKAMFSQACNTILLPVILNIVLDDKAFGSAGLASQAFDFQIVLIIMMINFNFVDVPYQFKKLSLCISPIKKYIIKSKCKVLKDIEDCNNYREVLQYYQGPDFPIAGAYVYMNTFIFHGMFYIHLQPCLFIVMVLNIMVFYFVKKYLLLRRCKIPAMIDMMVLENCLNSLMYTPLVYGTGSILFTCLSLKEVNYFWFIIPSILCILLGIINMIDPYNLFDEFVQWILKIRRNQIQTETSVGESSMNGQEAIDTPENLIEQQDRHKKAIQKKTLAFLLSNYQNFSQRIQCYYKECNLSKLLNYQQQFSQSQCLLPKSISSDVKKFCESFQQNYPLEQLDENDISHDRNQESHNIIRIKRKLLTKITSKKSIVKQDTN